MSYISGKDVDTVLDRIPAGKQKRLRDVFIKNWSFGVRRLGKVVSRGRRDIELYSVLPPRVSLGKFLYAGQSPGEFGAIPRVQWPPWAVRRFLLYDVLLHELGHLQVVHPKGRSWRRKYAGETKAEEFADYWRCKLWSEPLDHQDPVHSAPAEDEESFHPVWRRLNKADRFRLVSLVLRAPYYTMPDTSWMGELDEQQSGFLHRALTAGGAWHS